MTMMNYQTRLHTLKRLLPVLLSTAFLCTSLTTPVLAQAANEGIPTGKGSYQDLVELFDEFLAFRDAGDVEADFSAQSVAQRREQMQQFQSRIDDINIVSWRRAKQVDYLAVRSRLNQYDFSLQRIADTDRRIRTFLVEQQIITVPGDIGELDTNAPWIVSPGAVPGPQRGQGGCRFR